jgi:tetratricopeptide (TPR) repeat protein
MACPCCVTNTIQVLAIAEQMLQGEVKYLTGQVNQAFQHLRQAIDLEASLPYDEPWGWMQPARHAYGALLLEQNRVEEACQAYKEDLGFTENVPRQLQHRNNVWALHGLHECLVRLGRSDEASLLKGDLDLALELADVEIGASCFCRRGCNGNERSSAKPGSGSSRRREGPGGKL